MMEAELWLERPDDDDDNYDDDDDDDDDDKVEKETDGVYH